MYNCPPGPFEFNFALSKTGEAVPMLKVVVAVAAVVLSVEVVAISFAPGAEIATSAAPVRALKGDRLNTTRSVTPITPVRKNQPATPQVREVRLA
jgi:hypothetical protein